MIKFSNYRQLDVTARGVINEINWDEIFPSYKEDDEDMVWNRTSNRLWYHDYLTSAGTAQTIVSDSTTSATITVTASSVWL